MAGIVLVIYFTFMKYYPTINGRIIPEWWDQITFYQYEEIYENKADPVELFTGFSVDELSFALDSLTINNFITIPLSFLNELPKPTEEPSWGKSVKDFSINHKMIAMNIIKILYDQKKTPMIPSNMVALYTREVYNESQMAADYDEIIKRPFLSVYNIGMQIYNEIIQDDKLMYDYLSKFQIPYTKHQKQAGFDELGKHNSQLLIDRLAGGNVLLYEEAKSMSLKDVNAYLIMKQEYEFRTWKAHEYRRKEQEQINKINRLKNRKK